MEILCCHCGKPLNTDSVSIRDNVGEVYSERKQMSCTNPACDTSVCVVTRQRRVSRIGMLLRSWGWSALRGRRVVA